MLNVVVNRNLIFLVFALKNSWDRSSTRLLKLSLSLKINLIYLHNLSFPSLGPPSKPEQLKCTYTTVRQESVVTVMWNPPNSEEKPFITQYQVTFKTMINGTNQNYTTPVFLKADFQKNSSYETNLTQRADATFNVSIAAENKCGLRSDEITAICRPSVLANHGFATTTKPTGAASGTTTGVSLVNIALAMGFPFIVHVIQFM